MATTSTTEPIVRTSGGSVRGRAGDGVVAFKGIPYAAPPFGPLRFAAPQPHEPWDGVRDAFEYGATAPKPPYSAPYDALLPEPAIPGEDCLNLNVWTPDPAAGGLPVFVWIHGGAFVNGSGAVPTYDGSRFARDGVVAVTINYRLGVDGFAALEDAPDNRGLLDQIAALEWVRDNIAAFGGDPANVTIAGESAGGMSVGCLVSSPRAAGLFRRAISQSGAGHHVLSRATAQRVAGYVGERLGVAPTREGLGAVELGGLLAVQQAIAQEAQLNPDPQVWGEIAVNLMAFEPVVDGDVLPAVPIEGIAAGAGRGVDVLAGSNTDEDRLFLVPNGFIDYIDDNVVGLATMGYGVPRDEALRLYATAGSRPGDVLADLMGDWFFRIPAIRLAEAARAGGAGAYVYEFAWPSPQFGGRLGACHALEIGFVFDNLDADGGIALQGEAPPQALADEMHRAWVAFVTSGDPGWPAYDARRRPVMRFAERSEVIDDPGAERRALWDGVR